MAQKAIFLDRDDTLVDDPGYIKHPDQVRLLPGASEALIMLRNMGYLLIVVTNQSGVARGMITEEELDQIHKRFKSLLSAEGAAIDKVYYCPFHPEGVVKDFNIESNLRKPNAGMFFQAEEELNIDLSQSWMIGDSYRDIAAGKAAGCQTILVDVPGKIREKKDSDPEPDRSAVNLREAVNIIRMFEFHQKAQAARKAAQDALQPEPQSQPEKNVETTDEEYFDTDEPFNTPSDTPREELSQQEEHAVCSVAILPETESREDPEPETELQAESNTETQVQSEQDGDIAEKQQKIEKVPQARPEPAKVYTAKDKIEMQTDSNSNTIDETQHLLEEILHQLKHRDRENLYRDFSVYRLLSIMLEVVSVFCLVISVFFWLNPDKSFDQVLIMIGYAAAIQIMVIALLIMDSKD